MVSQYSAHMKPQTVKNIHWGGTALSGTSNKDINVVPQNGQMLSNNTDINILFDTFIHISTDINM